MGRKSIAIPDKLPMKRGGGGAAQMAAAAMAPSVKLTTGGVAQGLVNSLLYGMAFIVISLFAIIYFLTYLVVKNPQQQSQQPQPPRNMLSPLTGLPSIILSSVSTRQDPYSDPYAPPLKNDGMYFPPDSNDVRGIPMIVMPPDGGQAATCNSGMCSGAVGAPINVKTRGYSRDFTQIGLLTRERKDREKTGDTSFTDNMILPLFGRRVMNGRDKYQYYTMSNTGAVNTKLPVKVRGRNCINEYGCDELMNGDLVMVEGYNDSFRATVYENGSFSYIPYL